MSRVERTLRAVKLQEPRPRPSTYWRKRAYCERLAEVLALHREGNLLFRGGHPCFVYTLKVRDVGDP